MYDVVVIGAGVIGSMVARELSRFRLNVGVLEKNPDVCIETSGRNSGVLHAGFNNKPGSLMARFCVEGNRGFDPMARELDIPFRRTGKLVVGFTPEDRDELEKLKAIGDRNGVPGLEIVDKAFLCEKAPGIGGEFAMWCPSTAILNPILLTIGLAENAAKNGVVFHLEHEVTSIEHDAQSYVIQSGQTLFRSRWVVNCAGLCADRIAGMLGVEKYTIYPCRGEYFVLDQRIGHMLPVPAYPVPNYKTGGLGIHLTPTIDGNIIVGPSTQYIAMWDDYSATKSIMDLLIEDGSKIFPHLDKEDFIRNFSGIRPKLTPKSEGGYHDFVIERRERAINLLGVESPGLTSAQPIAREVVRLIGELERLEPNPCFDPVRRRMDTFHDKSARQRESMIRENPDYGEIICRCENITKAEVLAALHNPLGVHTVTGIKYRCRTMMGRCQGGYCQARVADLIMRETGLFREEVLYGRKGSWMFTGKVR